MHTIIALICLSILLAPLPPGMAINPQTRECGYYWGGDEWTHNELPAEWQIYYARGDLITTDAGSCPWQGNWDTAVESCCKTLGYTYIPGNLGVERGRPIRTQFAYMILAIRLAPFALVALIVIVVLLVRRRRRKAAEQRNGGKLPNLR